MSCERCICQFCANSVELDLRYFTQKEHQFCCFNCDECQYYDGNYRKSSKWKSECPKYKEAAKFIEMKALSARRKFKVIVGGKKR